jgi:hypothetical protein
MYAAAVQGMAGAFRAPYSSGSATAHKCITGTYISKQAKQDRICHRPSAHTTCPNRIEHIRYTCMRLGLATAFGHMFMQQTLVQRHGSTLSFGLRLAHPELH